MRTDGQTGNYESRFTILRMCLQGPKHVVYTIHPVSTRVVLDGMLLYWVKYVSQPAVQTEVLNSEPCRVNCV